jgi:hypothetical protein
VPSAIRDILDLEIDASVSAVRRFHATASTTSPPRSASRRRSSRRNERGGKISRLAIGGQPPRAWSSTVPEDTSQDYHVEGLPFGTRGGILVKHVFPSDGEYDHGHADLRRQHVAGQFGSVPCERLGS